MPLRKKAKERQGPPREPKWLSRARENVRTGTELKTPGGGRATMRTISYSTDKGHYLAPTIRKEKGKLRQLSTREAVKTAVKKRDALGPYKSVEDADAVSKTLSRSLDKYRKKK